MRLVLSIAEFGQRVHNAPTLIFYVMTRRGWRRITLERRKD